MPSSRRRLPDLQAARSEFVGALRAPAFTLPLPPGAALFEDGDGHAVLGACRRLGRHRGARASPAIANLVYLPGMWLSGMFFPLPDALRPWAVIWPAFHLNQTALGAAGIKEFSFVNPTWTAAVLVAITVLCAGRALRRLARVG